MSDRTYFQLVIADCPADQAGEILGIIEERGLVLNMSVTDRQSVTDNQLAIGATYSIDEINCGSAEDIAADLQNHAPNASWECWEDPKYDWMGDLFRFTPDLGLYREECDADGNPRLTPIGVDRIAELCELDGNRARDRALGKVHRETLDVMIQTAKDHKLDVVTAETDGDDT